uniref:Uncharacterized protein n=1 Tax=Caenorhabditis japonica TaxID=281687 RepID=A0A8R1E2U4_CAEJA
MPPSNFVSHQLTIMAHVESFYLDANLEQDSQALPQTENQLAEALFTADQPLTHEAIGRIVESQQTQENAVVSDYCIEQEQRQENENPNQVVMSSSILDNHKYFAPPPRGDSSQYAWSNTEVASSHQYAQSPNIYTNDYMTSEPSDYVYM